MKLTLMLGLWCGTLCLATAQTRTNIESTLETVDVKTGKRSVVLKEQRHFEAPNWSRDGKFFIINSGGKLEKISMQGKNLGVIPTGMANRLNNDHGLSFDGKMLIVSHNDTLAAKSNNSRIYTLPATGGTPRLITEKAPSYWHGVSPDGKTLVYCAQRDGAWDVYSISSEGGAETRLTTADGLDDGPEYSYDGRWIYFNSDRSGRMHLYRMRADGSEQEQLTNDEFDNWFGHPSPDGKWLVYISYLEDQKGQHPFGKDVRLRLMNLATRKSTNLTDVFFGGQGTINVPSWSPDGKKVAFVTYRQLPQ
jgi:TolB protein